MRGSFLVFIGFLAVACGGSGEHKEDFGQVSLSLDTVKVDAKGEILMAGASIFLSDLSPDRDYLYNFDKKNSLLEIINLDALTLEEKIKISIEGPNGVGAVVNRVSLAKEGSIAFYNSGRLDILNLEGEKIFGFGYRNHGFEEGFIPPDQYLSNQMVFLDQGNEVVGVLYSSKTMDFQSLVRIDFDKKKIEKIDIPELFIVNDFVVNFNSGNRSMYFIQPIYMVKVDRKILISNAARGMIQSYDIDDRTVISKKVESKIFTDGIQGEYKKRIESQEEINDETWRMDQEIQFSPLTWDPKNKRFYRFSYQKILRAENGNPSRFKVYLTVLDEELNVLDAVEVPSFSKKPNDHFVKNGKIWIYENMEDELGFIRLSIN